jgi:hypothetical protein
VPWGDFVIYGLLGAAGTWALVKIAEARDLVHAEAWGDVPHLSEEVKASAGNLSAGEGRQSRRRPSVTNQTQHSTSSVSHSEREAK